MKTLTSRSFLVGFFFGALIFSVLFYINRNPQHSQIAGSTEVKAIDNAAALILRNNYISNFPNRLHAINVSMKQVHAIKKAISEMKPDELKSLEGFRLYFASQNKNLTDTISSLVYPIYETEIQVRGIQTYMVSGIKEKYSLPCPPFCNEETSSK